MNEQLNWEIISKYLADECSSEERKEFEEWIKSDPENEKLFNSVKTIWNLPEEHFESSDIEQLWVNVTERTGISLHKEKTEILSLPTHKKRFPNFLRFGEFPVLRYAALILIIVSAYFIYSTFLSKTDLEDTSVWKSILVSNGQMETINLSDGTKIIADAGSLVQYPDNYGIGSRTIKLEGEAYFEVTYNLKLPLKVYSGNA